jgi:hypothetical protein
MNQTTTSPTFTIPEILELILTYLPPKDLLLSQRVAPFWTSTINKSQTLRHKLFLDHPTDPASPPKTPSIVLNHKTSDFPPPAKSFYLAHQGSDFEIHSHLATLNTLILHPSIPGAFFTRVVGREITSFNPTLEKSPLSASARQMHVCWPPCPRVSVFARMTGKPKDWGRLFERADGVRVGEVLDYAKSAPAVFDEICVCLVGFVCWREGEECAWLESGERVELRLVV